MVAETSTYGVKVRVSHHLATKSWQNEAEPNEEFSSLFKIVVVKELFVSRNVLPLVLLSLENRIRAELRLHIRLLIGTAVRNGLIALVRCGLIAIWNHFYFDH